MESVGAVKELCRLTVSAAVLHTTSCWKYELKIGTCIVV